MLVNKKGLIFIFILFLTGCSSNSLYSNSHINYTINFDKTYKEDIDIYMPLNALEIAESDKNDSTPPLEYSFLNENYYPFKNNYEITYNKSQITTLNTHTHINLNYDFNSSNYKDSTFLNRCFEYVSIYEEDEFINVILTGEFRCLYGDKVIINLKGKNLIQTNLEDNKIEIDTKDFAGKISFTISKIEANSKGDEIMKSFYIIGGVIIVIFSIITLIFKTKMNEN